MSIVDAVAADDTSSNAVVAKLFSNVSAFDGWNAWKSDNLVFGLYEYNAQLQKEYCDQKNCTCSSEQCVNTFLTAATQLKKKLSPTIRHVLAYLWYAQLLPTEKLVVSLSNLCKKTQVC